MSIIINNLTYAHPDGEVLFQNISITISKGQKVSLVGNNGVGKSTLLQLLVTSKKAKSGSITMSEVPYYVPQLAGQFNNLSLAEVLRVDKKLNALHAILAGNTSEDNLNILNDDWDIENRISNALSFWNIDHLDLSQKMEMISGGEKTKVFLAGISIHSPEIIIFDEPSNHLDLNSRELLYDFIKKSKSTFFIVSHDIELLNLVNTTIELNNKTATLYGGNYSFYQSKIQAETLNMHLQLAHKEKELKQARENARELAKKRQKQESRGKTQKQKAGIPRISMGRLKDNAEQSSAKIKTEQSEKVSITVNELKQLKEQIHDRQSLKIGISSSNLHKGKNLINANNINFTYESEKLWREPLSFQILSGDRVIIKGDNGSGKTTLVKIITKQLQVSEGYINIADFDYLYLDQEYAMINNDKTVYDQVENYNTRKLTEQELKDILHYHHLPYAAWNRPCHSLSGGEKMKLTLCCMAICNNLPDLLILDEPTNNVDIHSLEILTHAIQGFKGAVLVVSHDKHFVSKINVTKTILIKNGSTK